jgi:prepilin-type processing-associated H-X9-DG protein
MLISQSLLPEYDSEMANTRRVLERIPNDKLSWTPHPKSGTFAWLGGHVANIPTWITFTIHGDSFDVAPPGGGEPPKTPKPSSSEELLKTFEENVRAGRAAITEASDEQWMQTWSLLKGGEVVFAMPKVAVVRGMVMNHLIHHRAELCVYLRLNDIPVPGLYGPSADEPGF